jgi:hypothetical protein
MATNEAGQVRNELQMWQGTEKENRLYITKKILLDVLIDGGHIPAEQYTDMFYNDDIELQDVLQELYSDDPSDGMKAALYLALIKSKDIIEQNKKDKAKNKDGIIHDIGNRVALITDKNLHHALTPHPNKHAYIQQLDERYFSQLEFDPKDGTIRTKDNSLEPVLVRDIKTKTSPKELDLQLLRTLYTALFKNLDIENIEKSETFKATIYVPTLAKYMSINVRGELAGEFLRKVTAFQNVVGIFGDKSIYPLLLFKGYSRTDNTIIFETPYMYNLLSRLHKANIIPTKGGKQAKTNAYHSYLMLPSMGGERNKLAVEIVAVIIRWIEQRGTYTGKEEKLTTANIAAASEKGAIKGAQKSTVTARKAYKGIIEEIPALKETLNGATTASNKNTILKRAFEKAFELLHTQTEIGNRYKNFRIHNMPLAEIYKGFIFIRKKENKTECGEKFKAVAARLKPIIPTISTLNNSLIITHEGKVKA